MIGLQEDNNFKLRTIESLKNYVFLVEDYQRGYQWDEQQVLDLLNDIDTFEPNAQAQQFYCLQPVAVKEIQRQELAQLIEDEDLNINEFEKIFELIDGQQRLTTIFLILSLLTANKHHKIIYRTRASSKDYVNRIKTQPIDASIDLKVELEDLKIALNNSWKGYVEKHKHFDNVDNYHFYKAAQLICNYPYKNKEAFINKISLYTQVIWYNEVHKSPKKLFADLNSGKIKLTGAELIKALFVLHLSPQNNSISSEVVQFKINELAIEWDEIEYQMQQSDFWYFIKSKTKREYASRIGYLFDVILNVIDKEDDLYAYRMYANKEEELNWNTVKLFFQKLVEWYNDPYIYHRVGFLLFQRDNKLNSLKKLNEKSIRLSKENFKEALDDEIKNAFSKVKIKEGVITQLYHLDSLSYKTNKLAITHVLVLYNICLYENLITNYKVNFKEFYSQTWTLEHIFPQNLAVIKEKDEAMLFLEDYKSLLDTKKDKQEFDDILILEEKLKHVNDSGFQKLKGEMQELITTIIQKFGLDHIGNLTLLHQNENSSIGNKPFKAKRAEIINFSQSLRKGNLKTSFIPLGTLNVFTKFYTTQSHDLQFSYWAEKDAISYKEAINRALCYEKKTKPTVINDEDSKQSSIKYLPQ
ncbi:DUF262 domain-containing protein [Bizionia myxarmorum]|uniref:DUF262 domain-containing protein n=1 Tax=Bizionia myxarmorum TaxID=291186 RepID=A0A5D0REH9_9FLAO|nr:DUF262 domain-containing protein [Bizionia myxarmorum]TYB79175.1 DUF262 domain-containing protein [Bizionia myxarmorum]